MYMWYVCMYVNNDIDMTWHDFSLFLFIWCLEEYENMLLCENLLFPVLARGRTCSCRENYKFDRTLT